MYFRSLEYLLDDHTRFELTRSKEEIRANLLIRHLQCHPGSSSDHDIVRNFSKIFHCSREICRTYALDDNDYSY